MHRTVLTLGAIAVVAMLGTIAYGIVSGGFVDALGDIAAEPWGVVTLTDLGVGLMIIGAWIAYREGSIARALPWWIALVFTGNLAAGAYLIRVGLGSRDMRMVMLGER